MRGIKIPQYEFALKLQGGGAYARGGAYLRDTTVIQPVPLVCANSGISKAEPSRVGPHKIYFIV